MQQAEKTKSKSERENHVKDAFEQFDLFAAALNYVLRQFAVDQQVTRNGFIPVQDKTIAEQVYIPVLASLPDPKFASVNKDLAGMFDDYRDRNYHEVITKAHSAVQRFLQIPAGEEGKNARGELKDLFKAGKEKGVISTSRFGESLIKTLETYFPSERATNSTAKPALRDATPRDAKLMMDLVLVFMQHCYRPANADAPSARTPAQRPRHIKGKPHLPLAAVRAHHPRCQTR